MGRTYEPCAEADFSGFMSKEKEGPLVRVAPIMGIDEDYDNQGIVCPKLKRPRTRLAKWRPPCRCDQGKDRDDQI